MAMNKIKGGMSSDKENEKVKREIANIELMDHSDVELPEFDDAKQQHAHMSQKRQGDIDATEDVKRKVSAIP